MGDSCLELNEEHLIDYETKSIPTLLKFHNSMAHHRCIVGPVGSGKTSAATWELCYYLPMYLDMEYGFKRSRWAIVRNTFQELYDTTQKTVFEWFPQIDASGPNQRNCIIRLPGDVEAELWFRSCDRAEDMRKFKSMELTGFWIDESIEVPQPVKNMLKTRFRFKWRGRICPEYWSIETTNPPEVGEPIYYNYDWKTPVPGPPSKLEPLADHEGFWQPPRENEPNLPAGYYDQMIDSFKYDPDWISMYIEGKPGVLIEGLLVYKNYVDEIHYSEEPLEWQGGPLYLGWDNSGNRPACVVGEKIGDFGLQILREFYSDKYSIQDFAKMVQVELNTLFPGHEVANNFEDPAGEQQYPSSKKPGEFTSNADLMREIGIEPLTPAEQNLTARITAVDGLLARIDGLLLDPSCIVLRAGFQGKYVFPKSAGYIQDEYSEKPVKNRWAHLQDALQYLATGLFGSLTKKLKRKIARGTLERLRAIDERRQEYDVLKRGHRRGPETYEKIDPLRRGR